MGSFVSTDSESGAGDARSERAMEDVFDVGVTASSLPCLSTVNNSRRRPCGVGVRLITIVLALPHAECGPYKLRHQSVISITCQSTRFPNMSLQSN